MSDKEQSFLGGLAEPIVAAYRERILYALAVIATTVLAPFSLMNFFRGYMTVGVVSMVVVVVFVADAVAIYRKRALPVPIALAFAACMVALVVAIEQRGLLGIFWTFPAILLFHFVLERRFANLFNLTLVAVVAVVAYLRLETDVTMRIVVAQLLTITFTNIFSYVVEAEQRKETEQRRRLSVLVRATQAGFYTWERGNDAGTYSGRLKEMLGYHPDTDTSDWPSFQERMHPEDREQRVRLFQEGARVRGVPGGAHRLARGGDFRLQRAGGDYIWVQAQGLFIHDAGGRVTRYIASLVDVTERHRQQEELRRSHNQIEVQAQQLRDQNAELLDAIRVREEVERIARHDLKTPLNSILAVPRMLRERRRLAREEEALLGMVEGAAYRILDMVNLSVDLYRMEQGEYRFSPRVVDLAALVETVAREVGAHAATKGVKVTPIAGAACAWGSELLCYSVIANLLKNAVEASPDGATVTVDFREQGGAGGIELRIHNVGIVPEQMRGAFFRKYATSGKIGGSGLGTYSARLMARVQAGELSMETSAEAGTTLTLRLPAVPVGAALAPGNGGGARETAAPAPAPELPAMRVLVVDDDEFNTAFVRGALPSPPLEVATAINGRAAVDAVRANPPDVIFMDIEMPVMNGFEALAQVRALEAAAGPQSGRPSGRRAVVVAFSSYDDESMRRRCKEAGFDAYLSKPAPSDRIHDILRAVAEGRALSEPQAAAGGHSARAAALGPDDPVILDADLAAALPRFLQTRRALLAELRVALAAGEREQARKLAHKLAGAFALYHFDWAAAASRALQDDAAAGDLAVLLARCEALQSHLERVRLQPRDANPEAHERAQETAAGR